MGRIIPARQDRFVIYHVTNRLGSEIALLPCKWRARWSVLPPTRWIELSLSAYIRAIRGKLFQEPPPTQQRFPADDAAEDINSRPIRAERQQRRRHLAPRPQGEPGKLLRPKEQIVEGLRG